MSPTDSSAFFIFSNIFPCLIIVGSSSKVPPSICPMRFAPWASAYRPGSWSWAGPIYWSSGLTINLIRFLYRLLYLPIPNQLWLSVKGIAVSSPVAGCWLILSVWVSLFTWLSACTLGSGNLSFSKDWSCEKSWGTFAHCLAISGLEGYLS